MKQKEEKDYSNADTQFTYQFFFTYPLLLLRSVSRDSVVTKLHIFLPHPYSC
jgi:hypothetical protein